MQSVRAVLVQQVSNVDNLFFLSLGFALYAIANYVASMMSMYREYVNLSSWLNSRRIDIKSLDKRELSKFIAIYRLSKVEGVEILSIDDIKEEPADGSAAGSG